MRFIWAVWLAFSCLAALMAASFTPADPVAAHGGAHVSVLTRSYNNSRTGANLSERILTPNNVGAATFGKLYSRSVDGQIYAQPLYMSELTMPDGEPHNVVFVATQKNNVYAFDADDPAASQPLWQVNLGLHALSDSSEFGYRYGGRYYDIQPYVGITGTPVIDSSTGTLYVVTFVRDPSQPLASRYGHYLHALNIFTGVEKFNGPKKIAATVTGSGEDLDEPSNGSITFDSRFQLQRPSLLLLNGIVYIGFAGYADTDPYHGWLLGYDAQTLEQRYVFCTTPDEDGATNSQPDENDGEGGIWMSGQGPSADANGDIYFVVGNGNFNASSSGRNYGNSVLRVRPNNGALDVQTFFTPYNYQYLNAFDLDLGVTTALLIPGTNLTLAGSKEGKLYLLDRTSMGGRGANDDSNAKQSFLATGNLNQHIHGSPVYWESSAGAWVYLWGETDKLRAFRFNKALGLFQTPAEFTSDYQLYSGMPGGIVSLSANGSDPNSGIIWATTPVGDANPGTKPGVLRAYRAGGPVGGSPWQELWKSDDNPGRDGPGNFAKFNPPMVADGKVFVASFALNGDPANSDKLVVYGLLAPSIVEQPENTPITFGQTAILRVVATGQGPLSYQWYQGNSGNIGSPIAGATESSLKTPQLSTTARYWVRVSNTAGSVDSTAAVVEINRAVTTLSLSGSAASRVYGEAVKFSAQVGTLVADAGQPSGTVTFRDGSTVLGTSAMVDGKAELTTNALAVGSRQIVATYNGDATFSQATSPAVVVQVTKAPSVTEVMVAPAQNGAGLTLHATVTASTAPIPTGMVTFYNGAEVIATVALDSLGRAVALFSPLHAGDYQLSATYSGSEYLAESRSSTVSATVNSVEYRTLVPIASR